MSAVRHATATLATALAVSLLPACQTSEAGRRYPTEFAGTSMTDRQLRTKLYDFVVRTSGRIEGAAERIERESESPEVQLFALRWKLFSITATQMAAFDADPAIGAVDSWVLAVQTREFLETDVAEARFGEHRDLALATARVIEADIESILDALSTEERADVARARAEGLAKLARARGEADLARERFEASLQVHGSLDPPDPSARASVLEGLGWACGEDGLWQEGIDPLSEALELGMSDPDTDPFQLVFRRLGLAECLERTGDAAAAAPLVDTVLEVMRPAVVPDDPYLRQAVALDRRIREALRADD